MGLQYNENAIAPGAQTERRVQGWAGELSFFAVGNSLAALLP
jgi:hypothetical protein